MGSDVSRETGRRDVALVLRAMLSTELSFAAVRRNFRRAMRYKWKSLYARTSAGGNDGQRRAKPGLPADNVQEDRALQGACPH